MLLPRAYGFYNNLLKVRITYLYCATFSIIALSVGIWWYFLYEPLIDATDILQQHINQIHVQVNELRKTEKTLLKISQSIDAQSLQKYSESKKHTSNSQQNLSLLADYAMNSGITVESFKVCGQHKQSWCSIIDMAGDFKGSLNQIIAFLEAIKNSKQIIDVSKCELTSIEGNTMHFHALFNVYCV